MTRLAAGETLPPEVPSRRPRRALGPAQAGILGWTDRAGAVIALAACLGALLFAAEQLPHLNRLWVTVVGGALVATGVLMPIYAWSQRGVRVPATLYAGAIAVGLITWPFAWEGQAAAQAPWFWPCIGAAAVVLCIAWNAGFAATVAVVNAALYLAVRTTPSGGHLSTAAAVQDALAVGVQPLLIVILFAYMRGQSVLVDARLAEARRQESEAALSASLETRRSQLDAVVHDHVMTALVAAARSAGPHDAHVTDLAEQAVARVEAQAVRHTAAGAFSPTSVEHLLTEAALSAGPLTRIAGSVDPAAPMVPQQAARALAQATREAVLNAEKHADADNVTLRICVSAVEDAVAVRVEVRDDGVGFDTGQVSTHRLGIRLSLRERMRAVGGDAEVTSAPGAGTTVVLEWAGGEPAATPAEEHPLHPLLGAVSLRPIELILGLNLLVIALTGLLGLGETPRPWLLPAAAATLLVSGWIALVRFGQERLSIPRAALVMVGGLATTLLGLGALPSGTWSIHETWFVSGISLLVVLLLSGARRVPAWALAFATVALLLGAAWFFGMPVWLEIVIAAEPVAWLVIAEMLLVWLDRIQEDLESARRQAEDASATNAAAFAGLVMREVWLADLDEQFGGMLARLRDPAHVITAAEREECLRWRAGCATGSRRPTSLARRSPRRSWPPGCAASTSPWWTTAAPRSRAGCGARSPGTSWRRSTPHARAASSPAPRPRGTPRPSRSCRRTLRALR